MKRWFTVGAALALLIAGCGKKRGVPAAVATPRVGAQEEGIASWYGHPYHGRASSSGEIYDMEQLTAAHRTLPFGTKVGVRNLDNGLRVNVRINDRGPFVDGRIIDLSRAAARKIGMLRPGIAKVRIHVLALPEEETPGYFAVQVGAFRNRGNAERRRREIEKRYGPARLERRDARPPVWRVLVGRSATEEEAAVLAEQMRSENVHAFVVRVQGGDSN
jgi:rare lipoprotein A